MEGIVFGKKKVRIVERPQDNPSGPETVTLPDDPAIDAAFEQTLQERVRLGALAKPKTAS